MKKARSGKLFRQYAASYLMVVLIVCLALGAALMALSARELKKSERSVYRSRAVMAADYLERQFAVMEDIRLKVQTDSQYLPFYLAQNHYNDWELLNAFSRFADYSPWVHEYYLWYLGMGRVFGAKNTYTPEVFLQRVMKMEEAELLSLGRQAGRQGVAFTVPESRPDTLLACLPLTYGAGATQKENCLLLFVVKRQQIAQDIALMTGQAQSAPYALSYNGWEILSAAIENPLRGMGTGGKLTLTLDEDSFESGDSLGAFYRMLTVIIAGVALAGMALAVWAAWKNSRPILRLYHQYVQSSPPRGHFPGPSNELKTIETLLHEATENAFLSRKQLDKQLEIMNLQRAYLKQQMVMMLISGNESPVVSRQIQEMGYRLDHGMYAVLFIHLEEGGNTTDLLRDVEGFSDEEYTLYMAELQSGREYAALLSFEEEEQCQDIVELLGDTLLSRGLRARVQVGRACVSLDQIAAAAIEALNQPSIRLPAGNAEAAENEEDLGLRQVLSLTETGAMQQALALLDALLLQTERRYPSYILRIYILNVLYQRLYHEAVRRGVIAVREVPPGNADPETLAENMRQLVRSLCAAVQAAPPEREACMGGEVSEYVRKNCLDAKICLASTAEALGISTKQVARLLRGEINMTFKEYLVQLRMEEAKKILRDENLSIAETAEKVGYCDISHFIKCFKQYVGVTPGEWKKLVNAQ